MTFFYYKGNWVDGHQLLAAFDAATIIEADKLFEQQFGYSPHKPGVSVTLQPLGDS